jgi:hypothetical protein
MDVLSELAGIGAERLFGRSNYANNHLNLSEIRLSAFKTGHLDVFLNSLSLDDKATGDIFRVLIKLVPEEEVFKSSFLKNAIEKYTSSEYIKSNLREIANDSSSYTHIAAEKVSEFVWLDLFNKVYSSGAGRSATWIPRGIRGILAKCIVENPKAIKELAEKELFSQVPKPHHSWRSIWYREYIKTGSLTKKQARKIRSESSSSASYDGVRAIIANKSLYPNYDELLLSISDSKYEQVLHLLAKELPIHLLTSIMGTQSQYVLNAIERRMKERERLQEKNNDVPF